KTRLPKMKGACEMISPEHVDEQKPENEHVSSSTEGQQSLPTSEKKRPWLNSLMRVISIVLALVGSFASVWVISNNPISIDLWWIMLVILVYAAFCAVLFRSMWAALIIPIALNLGVLLAELLWVVVLTHSPVEQLMGIAVLVALYVTLPALLGAIIGGFFGVAWKERWWW
ncbi:MAG TPA: hypothetical protein VEI53_04490, partial [Ktedonobacteraceae bacterium]|nr:hypothetical protein [Ktedonobacteraceae bacterium]